jgi:hypothetical protein
MLTLEPFEKVDYGIQQRASSGVLRRRCPELLA